MNKKRIKPERKCNEIENEQNKKFPRNVARNSVFKIIVQFNIQRMEKKTKKKQKCSLMLYDVETKFPIEVHLTCNTTNPPTCTIVPNILPIKIDTRSIVYHKIKHKNWVNSSSVNRSGKVYEKKEKNYKETRSFYVD